MSVLSLKYDVWKSITQSGNLHTAYQTTVRNNRIYAWAGNNTDLFRTVVDSDDYPDWFGAFGSNSIQVSDENEALAKLIEASSGGAINSTNAVTIAVGPDTSIPVSGELSTTIKCPIVTAWPTNTSIYDDEWVTAYQDNTGGKIFYVAVFSTNTTQMDFQLEVDGITVMDVNLDDVSKTYGLDGTGTNILGVEFPIAAYASKSYRIKFRGFVKVDSSISFKFKSEKKTKTVYNGLISMGEQ